MIYIQCNNLHYFTHNWLYEGYETPVPSDYDDLPQLKGRATVEMTVKKPDGEKFDIEGSLYNEAKMKMIIDGYSCEQTDLFCFG